MRQKIDVGALYAEAVEQMRATDHNIIWPTENPYGLDDLLNADTAVLLGRFPAPE